MFEIDNQRRGDGLALPDVVRSHGIQFDLSIEARRPLPNPAQSYRIPPHAHNIFNQPIPQHGNNMNPDIYMNNMHNNHNQPLNVELEDYEGGWNLDVKFSVQFYRDVGRDLRIIADYIELQVSLGSLFFLKIYF